MTPINAVCLRYCVTLDEKPRKDDVFSSGIGPLTVQCVIDNTLKGERKVGCYMTIYNAENDKELDFAKKTLVNEGWGSVQQRSTHASD